jgi:hypothetical protein
VPQYLLKDGRVVDGSTIVDFDERNTNRVIALDETLYAQFVDSVIPDPPPPPPGPPTINAVTPRQARLALLDAGLLPQINMMIRGADEVTQITWDYATVISREDPLIASIGSALSLTDAQIDALFDRASTL